MRLVNPVMKGLLRFGGGPVGSRVLVLEFTGRETGRQYSTPVGFRRIDGRLALLTDSGWRHNLRDGADVTVTLEGKRVPARAELFDDPAAVVTIVERTMDEVGWRNAGRRLGVRVNVERRPTPEELLEMVRTSGLSVVWIDPVEREPSSPR